MCSMLASGQRIHPNKTEFGRLHPGSERGLNSFSAVRFVSFGEPSQVGLLKQELS
jgi:hypothetical protein